MGGRKPTIEYLPSINCCVDKKKLKLIRKEKKMRLDEVAKLAKISRGLVWKMESYNFGMQLCHFIKVCKVLNVDPIELLIDDTSTIQD